MSTTPPHLNAASTATSAPSAAVTAVDAAVEISGLRRVYGTGSDAFEAVRGLDLTVARGTVHALLGVNGAGKTSTLEVVEGLAPATAGTVRVLGLDPVADRAEVRRRTGVLLQHSGFVGDLTVRETLKMWGATVTGARPVDELIAMLRLEKVADTRMRGLSGGEHRRVDLACTLSGHPELVMLDEPTTGLDPESRRAVWDLVRDLRDGGATVLLTTHYLEEAEVLADQVSIMRAGQVVREGTVAGVVAGHPSEISFVTTDDGLVPALVAAGLPADAVGHDDDRTVLRVADLQPVLTDLLLLARQRDARLDLLDARTATLESVFLSLAADADAPAVQVATTAPGAVR
ncbi:ABC transporter ATP-binding protein [Nocardioides yefusunii]|uniref:ABC transporter ATP-binding protein n=1 Tax=Nocardioides yefusunii TaxID=2500546 RepID=A0ABW1R1S3_9ACTN|nr:ABC transporter ATP-binding protein [Nocardioides yefusunii]